jgi:hypothetical protein
MNYAQLRQEILSGPHAAACAPYVINWDAPKTPGSYQRDQAIADILNSADGGSTYFERFITARTLLAELDPTTAATILDKLEATAQVNSVVKWAMKYITTDGIDIGHASTHAVLDAVLTAEESAAVKALATKTVKYAELVLGASVNVADVSIALRGNAAFDPRI